MDKADDGGALSRIVRVQASPGWCTYLHVLARIHLPVHTQAYGYIVFTQQ
jgi:hypothetical protein